MYLYFNEQGVLTTQIPHGEIVRQSGTFTMHFVFENDYDFVNQHTLTIAFKRPGEKDFGIFRYITTNQPRIEIFKKVKPSEVTYSFVEGQAYKIYEFVCDELVAATERAGEVQAVVRILDKNSLNHGKVSVENIIAQGLIQFHVERTFGIPYSNTISPSQYSYLLAYISQNIEGIKGAYIKDITYNSEKYAFVITKQDGSTISVDLPIETQAIDIQQNKENIARIEQNLNTALNNLILSDNYELTFTTIDGRSTKLDFTQIGENKQNIGTLQNDLGVIRENQNVNTQDIRNLKEKVPQIDVNTQNISRIDTSNAQQNQKISKIEGDISKLNEFDKSAVKVVPQSFSESEKQQARENIGVDVSQFIRISEKGARNGIATLDSDGFLTPEQIPSHLDEVISGILENNTTFRDREGEIVTPKEYCIYFDYEAKKRYGWSGSEYVELTSGGLVLGITKGTAYDGADGEKNRQDILKKQDKLSQIQLNNIATIPNKLDRVSSINKVYTTDGVVSYDTNSTGNTFVKRLGDGRIKANRPLDENDVVTKGYMQEFGGKIDATDLYNLLESQNNIVIEKNENSSKVIIKNSDTVVTKKNIATNNDLGLIKVGDDFDISNDGLLTLYKPIEILSFTNNVGSVAKGQTINEVVLNWQTSKLPKTIKIDEGTITPNTTTTKTFSGLGLKNNKTFTLKVIDNRNKESIKTTSISFNNYVLYGTGVNFDENNLTKVLKTTRVGVYDVNAGDGEYIYFSIPTSLGMPTFYVGGFEGGFALEKTYMWDNGFGYTESYNVYKSSQTGLGETKVEVK